MSQRNSGVDEGAREDLVRRVASSATFEKSPRLRAFFLHVCRCALDRQPEAATEQQIGIHVFGRPAGYNPNEDNIVRSQARLLRMKLEHHFASEGKEEPVVITIPKGRYLPVFEPRAENPALPAPAVTVAAEIVPRRRRPLPVAMTVAAAAVLVAAAWLAWSWFRGPAPAPASPARAVSRSHKESTPPAGVVPTLPPTEGIRIAAGNTGPAFVDSSGRRWDTDRYHDGGVARPGPKQLFPPVADARLFANMREAASGEVQAPQSQREFRYDIPVKPGTYELRLYFADPLRPTGMDPEQDDPQDGQNQRRFQVECNGNPLLLDYDPVAGAAYAGADVRAFRDITPAPDGKIHLVFTPGPGMPFLNALELTPGTPGKLRPVRICARPADVLDASGERFSGDAYFIHGRSRGKLGSGSKTPELYEFERYGNFSYAIPVPPGSYTVRLHFLESFFSPTLLPAGLCRGEGCRLFDVTCNGVMLLRSFDVYEAAGGDFRPVIRTFHGLRPNGQGKLLVSFWSWVNYAEIRAIEVLDEAK